MKRIKQQFAPRWLGLGLALLLVIGLSGIAFAAATFSNQVGPTWLNPGYQWTLTTSGVSTPDKGVCIEYSIDGGAAVETACSCVGADCTNNNGNWTCTAPTNATTNIVWTIGTYTGGGACGNLSTAAPGWQSVTTPVRPSAVDLNGLAAARGAAGWQMAAIALLGLLGLGAGLWWAHSPGRMMGG